MKEKIALPGDLIVRQDLWNDSPCSHCDNTPCCSNLPLAPFRLESQSDFIDLLLLSTYSDIFPGLKRSGEWTIYLQRKCRFLQPEDGKCTIHTQPHQSLICKSYDAHNCWYTDAFSPKSYSTMIPFNTSMLIWMEKEYELIKNRFDRIPAWDDLCRDAFEFRKGTIELPTEQSTLLNERKLSFKKSRSDEYLFFQPYQRPENIKHFELMSFRLGFPGVSLAVSDTTWSYIVKTGQNGAFMNLIRDEYYPGLNHKDGCCSFDGIEKRHKPFSEAGDLWVIIERNDLPLLKSLTLYDDAGHIRKLPATGTLLQALDKGKPDKAA
ncbi:hypothetical protein [Spirochaeta isovalerica]|uniref:Uncharacterized protein n=1 Tax=Spirochaeta isovalerica TaxID=150 RepID=A0A841R7N6_9SPIO|nr:hypothetical protein [Spirochaeta isovalerica]MBB6479391.1 hypothetical protein [Spirochaeta isovalerica]